MGDGSLAEGGRGDAVDLHAPPGGPGVALLSAEVVAPAHDDGDGVASRDEVLGQVGGHLAGRRQVGGEELVEEEDVHSAAPIRRSFTRTAGTPT